MRIERNYHFYAGHRNQTLVDNCSNIHGHRYGITVVIQPERTTAGVTMLFGDIDKHVEPLISRYDHALMIDRNDPLYKLLASENQLLDGTEPPNLGRSRLKVVVFDEETSAENLARRLFNDLVDKSLPLIEVRVQETDSSVVIYDINDYRSDCQ